MKNKIFLYTLVNTVFFFLIYSTLLKTFFRNIDNFFTDEIKIYIRDQTVEQEALGHHVDRHHHEHKFKR